MSSLSEYFQVDQEPKLHLKARRWRNRLTNGDADAAKCEVWRKREGLTFAPARLIVTFYSGGREVGVEEAEWDPGLNTELARMGVQASSGENEALRLGLMMQDWFSVPEGEYGDGFFNAVLIDYLRQSAFADVPQVSEALTHVHRAQPNRETLAYEDCVRDIEAVIRLGAYTLVELLDYNQAGAETILADAIVHYLDDRFSITNRRLLGMA